MHSASTGIRMKVCGITRPEEIGLLESLPVEMIGLWHGVRGGRADLALQDCRRLAAAAQATDTLEPVLVTFLSEPDDLKAASLTSGVRWVQLHGYQTPTVVSTLKRAAPGRTRVIKVLHVRAKSCLEAPLIGAYEKAGVDAFLFDVATADGRIGSTGQSLEDEVVSSLARRLTRPFLLAGGIDSENWREHAMSLRLPHCFAIDVDTGARDRDGSLCPERIEAIASAWKVRAREGERVG
ncbi:MAG: N-(5'-phosphoribosyl)anthranilate isomerase [Actinomycetota bacterium]|nr:N-(5'-phosphoribosyl)anthranilate isomerase [Actinomycetota bacterium]